MPPAYTQVKVRVQARGGKILGPAPTVKQPLLSVRNVLTGETLISDAPMNNGSSGTVVPASQFSDSVSRNAIVVQPPAISPTYPTPGPYWLEVPDGQGELIVQLQIDEPSLLEFRATAYAPDPVYASATMWVMPGMQLLANPGLVLTIAGLYATVEASASNGTASISANVTMMCGCPITVQPSQTLPPNTEPYWPSSELEVTAQLRANGGSEMYASPLKCTSTSTYTGFINVPPGAYDVWVVAVQANETNVGFARTTLMVP
jgi:hypothetical protein